MAAREIQRMAGRSNAVPGYSIVPLQPALAQDKICEGHRFLGRDLAPVLVDETCRQGAQGTKAGP